MVRALRVSIVFKTTMVIPTKCTATWPLNPVGSGHW